MQDLPSPRTPCRRHQSHQPFGISPRLGCKIKGDEHDHDNCPDDFHDIDGDAKKALQHAGCRRLDGAGVDVLHQRLAES